MGYSIVHIAELEPGGPGGAVRFVRRELGVEAFGINWFELGPNVVGREHDESDTGQEEVNASSAAPASIASTANKCRFGKAASFASTPRRPRFRSPAPTA